MRLNQTAGSNKFCALSYPIATEKECFLKVIYKKDKWFLQSSFSGLFKDT